MNYRSLSSWKDFMQFPILIFGKCEIRSLVGSIEFPNGISFGQVKIGLNDFRSKGPFKIFNQGTIIFRGNSVIYSGSELDVFPNAVLDLGDDVQITENVLIFCTNRISIHEHSCVTYNCNILDSDFHHVVDLSKRIIYGYSKPIEIGAYNWIGNNTTIKKGVKTPNYTIVAAAYSLLTKDYTDLPEASIIGGMPAKLIKSNVKRIWDENWSAEMIGYFSNHMQYCLDDNFDIELLTKL